MHALQSGKWNDLYIVSMNMKLVEVYHGHILWIMLYTFARNIALSTCDVVSCMYKCGACSCLSLVLYVYSAVSCRNMIPKGGCTEKVPRVAGELYAVYTNHLQCVLCVFEL